jgi:hypothetical protein
MKKVKEIGLMVLKFLKSKKEWINMLILFIVYGINSNASIEVILGLWIFSLISVYAWDWFLKNND